MGSTVTTVETTTTTTTTKAETMKTIPRNFSRTYSTQAIKGQQAIAAMAGTLNEIVRDHQNQPIGFNVRKSRNRIGLFVDVSSDLTDASYVATRTEAGRLNITEAESGRLIATKSAKLFFVKSR